MAKAIPIREVRNLMDFDRCQTYVVEGCAFCSHWLDHSANILGQPRMRSVLWISIQVSRYLRSMSHPVAPPYKPKHKIRIVTAASLFDGHDALIQWS